MDVFDLLLPPIYLFFVIVIAHKYSQKMRRKSEVYAYFLPGLLLKIFGAISLGLVYFLHYKGGDTMNYHYTASVLTNLCYDNFETFQYVYFGKPQYSEFYLMNSDYNFTYWVHDSYAFFVSKCFVPFVMISGKSYMATAIVIASVTYLPLWKLFLIFCREFPTLVGLFKWTILYTPSVVFWGSGIMKDSITLGASCMYVHGFYWFFTQRKFHLKYALSILVGIYFLLSIKPYILFALVPGSILWFATLRINKLKNMFVKVLFTPTLIFLGVFLGLSVLDFFGDALGNYSMDKVINTASEAQKDLKQSYYSGNSFDIGDYEPTIQGMLSVSHKAIFATLFRPTMIDVRNVVMFISSVENTIILLATVLLLIRLKLYGFFGLLTSHPLLMFSVVFSLFFAFSVGVSISNFGTLVRLKIPCIPFFLSSLVIINYYHEQSKLKRS